jgi:hypothetical protein
MDKTTRILDEVATSLRDDIGNYGLEDTFDDDYKQIPFLVFTRSKTSIYSLHQQLDLLKPHIVESIKLDNELVSFLKEIVEQLEK